MNYSDFLELKEFTDFKDNSNSCIVADGSHLPEYYTDYIDNKDNAGYYFQYEPYINMVKDRRY